MNIEKFHPTWMRLHGFRKAGGLFFGLKINYPISVYDGPEKGGGTTETKFTSMVIHLGLGVATVSFELKWNIKPIQPLSPSIPDPAA